MFRHGFRAPSPALVIAMVALFAALGGTSFAATKVIASSHPDKKADTKLVKKLAPTLSVKHATTANSATSATNATNATNATHATNATNATSASHAAVGDSPLAWAQVAANGTVVAGRGITNANVSLQSTSAYCFTGLGFSFKSASVTPDYGTAIDAGQTATFALGNPFGDCTSAQAEVATADNFTFTPTGFFIQFYN